MEQTIINGSIYNDTTLNTIPKSDMELYCIQYYRNAGGGISDGVTNITFNTKQVDTHGLWTGTTMVTPFTGSYSISGLVYAAAASALSIQLYIDGVESKRLGVYIQANSRIFSGDAYILKGKTISLRPRFGSDTLINNDFHTINITAWRNRRTNP